jgi:hypothetical protein
MSRGSVGKERPVNVYNGKRNNSYALDSLGGNEIYLYCWEICTEINLPYVIKL